MTPDTVKNKAIASKFFKLISEGNVEDLCSMITPDRKMHIGLGSLQIPAGPEGLRKLFESFGNIEQQWIIEDVLRETRLLFAQSTAVNRKFFLEYHPMVACKASRQYLFIILKMER